MAIRDLTNMTFGRLTVLKMLDERQSGSVVWLCKCSCGKEIKVSSKALTTGNTRSCGCLKNEVTSKRSKKEMIGKRCGRLIVISESSEKTNSRLIKWNCICDCGNHVTVSGDSLRKGLTKSCGCLNSDKIRYIAQNIRNYKTDFENKHKIDLTGQQFGHLIALYPTEKRNHGKVIWVCKCDCSKLVEVDSNHLRSGNTQSCGHTSINENLTDEERQKHRYELHGQYARDWRTKVYERDNYTCVCCGKKGHGNLNAHHLDGWNWCKEKRFTISNGVTLCTDCHKLFHSEFGEKNNTSEQFEEFIKQSYIA